MQLFLQLAQYGYCNGQSAAGAVALRPPYAFDGVLKQRVAGGVRVAMLDMVEAEG